ncbi:MAG: N-6 DNA methylase [Candidatus Hermodarchaeota archaeon]
MPVQKNLKNEDVPPKEGYLIDYISGEQVKAIPEEVEAVQPFEQILVRELGYSKKQIQTRPQFYIRKGTQKIGPVDIAVFKNEKKRPDDLYLIVECKSKTRKDGKHQLKSYLNPATAALGVWFNGKEHLYLQKVIEEGYKISYREIPALPKKGQRIEDIGIYKRKDLRKPSNLTLLFKDIRNHLAGTLTGITRDEIIAQQIINLLFCKISDEIEKNPEDQVSFRVGVNESAKEVKKRIDDLFAKVKAQYNTIFSKTDQMELDGKALIYIIGQLQDYCLIEAERDAVRKAFEVFIGPALRGSEGQFFTPRNVIRMCIDIVDPQPGDVIIDPACGSGGFLVIALTSVLEKLEEEAKKKNWSTEIFYRKRNAIFSKCFRGIDKDKFLTKVTKAYMAIIGNGKEGIFCENSLENPSNWDYKTQTHIKLDSFDALFTNPPFGAKIKVKGDSILSQYELGYKWAEIKGVLSPTEQLRDKQPPQILFIERCLQFLNDGGKMAIVLPEGILGNPTQEYIRSFIFENSKVMAIVDAPIETFLPNTSTKTCILFLEKGKPKVKDYQIFMAIAEKCGHDSRDNTIYKINSKGEYIYDAKGNKIIDDDFPEISKKYEDFKHKKLTEYDQKGFALLFSELRSSSLIPRFYDPTIKESLEKLKEDYDLITIGELIDNGVLSLFNGQGIKKEYYGTGDIPYIRTSDISNWELKTDPSYSISEEIYETYKQDLRTDDILLVKDGGRLIGSTCLLFTDKDTKCLIQTHFQILRCEKKKQLDPYLLLYLLNKPIVKRQVSANIVIQSTIATIGERTLNVYLPIPKDIDFRKKIIEQTKEIIKQRTILREEIEKISYKPLI